jgi:hypothetical protein
LMKRHVEGCVGGGCVRAGVGGRVLSIADR